MTIKYFYSTEMILNFDNTFDVEITTNEEKAIEKAIQYMNIYGFSVVDIINANTGEILIHIEDD